ncbi:putative pre-16S rRNA nuclease [Mesoplasma lactucae ATCC 49193]|uniref:Putative pre-16S rRNA nuclease n=2 Tax=Mesoplasma lactucae TaxID=138853 RepID=A0A291IS91_9MOLU|nr:Holliday junction resolvase RuvX [Mesoplasma lactucae]ATG97576.1 Holliday junction resolvase RuvX [Mesoplasma lactucae ATCC 49193]ATZ19965.1 Holliday junction DNA helicase [Mesoplasma lactucae ATCC 49193]MCL8217084.1 putative pre-16S rRNA nuclease [Mesoplasma lactucae ATCC 49193]
MSKYIGIDLGSKTIGLATSEGLIANPGPTIRFEEWNFDEGIDKFNDYLKNQNPEKIIIGYPKNMDGSIGERAEMVDFFVEGFLLSQDKYDEKDIIRVDERRTTKMARSIMIEAGVRRDKQKQKKDSLAAQLILEQYLNSVK